MLFLYQKAGTGSILLQGTSNPGFDDEHLSLLYWLDAPRSFTEFLRSRVQVNRSVSFKVSRVGGVGWGDENGWAGERSRRERSRP